MSSDCFLTLQIITSPFTATSTLLMERSLAQLWCSPSPITCHSSHFNHQQVLDAPSSSLLKLWSLLPGFQVRGMPFLPPWPPGRRSDFEKEPKLECRVGGGCAHTPSDEQRTRSRTPTRAFTGTPKERGSQGDVRGVVLQDVPFTFLYCLDFLQWRCLTYLYILNCISHPCLQRFWLSREGSRILISQRPFTDSTKSQFGNCGWNDCFQNNKAINIFVFLEKLQLYYTIVFYYFLLFCSSLFLLQIYIL